jgi:hypothetical protein
MRADGHRACANNKVIEPIGFISEISMHQCRMSNDSL